jgi:hypothetical protein
MKIYFFLLNILLLTFTILSQSKDKKKEIIFIKPFIKKENANVDQKLVDTISQQFYLSAHSKYSDNYDVNDDSVMKVLNKKYMELLSKNCDADKCMEQIAENTKAKFSIYGEIDDVKGQPGFFLIKMQNLVRDSDGNTSIKVINVSFQEFQKDYYVSELIKGIENPSYKPDSSKAPKNFSPEIQVANLTFKPIETGNLPDINAILTDNTSADIARYKRAVEEGNKLREENKILEASAKYLQIYQNILQKDEVDRKTLKSFSDVGEIYFNNIINEYHKNKIESISSKTKGFESDTKILENSISELTAGLKEYESLQNIAKYPPKAYIPTIASAYKERIELIRIQIFKNAELRADQRYYSQDLGGAISEYKTILKNIRQFEGSEVPMEWKKLKSSIESKISTTEKNGASMVSSLVEQLIDAGENHYEDWTFDKENKNLPKSCKETFDKALKILMEDEKYKPFISKELIARYNAKVYIVRGNPDYPPKFYPLTFDEKAMADNNKKAQEAYSNEQEDRIQKKFDQNKFGYITASFMWPGLGQSMESNHWKGSTMSLVSGIIALDFVSKYYTYADSITKYKDSGSNYWAAGQNEYAIIETFQKGRKMDSAAQDVLNSGQNFTLIWAISLIDIIFIRPGKSFSLTQGTPLFQFGNGGLFFDLTPKRVQTQIGSFSNPIESYSQFRWEQSF